MSGSHTTGRISTPVLAALVLLAGCAGLSQKADYDWGAQNCRDRGLTEGTPAFQDCVAGEIRGLHQTWQDLDRIHNRGGR